MDTLTNLLDWSSILSGTLIAIIGCLVRHYSKKIEQYKKKIEADRIAREEAERARKKQIDYVIEHFSEIVEWQKRTDERLDKVSKSLERSTERIDKIIDGGLALLRDRILQSCRFFIEQGHTNYIARENITDMYKAYHDHGGNGIVTKYYNEYMQLPVTATEVSIKDSETQITSSCLDNSELFRHKNKGVQKT